MLAAAKSSLAILVKTFRLKSSWEEYLNEGEIFIGILSTTLIKYFARILFQVIVKSIQMTISRMTLKCINGLKFSGLTFRDGYL